MARRRRAKNNLLPKMIGVAILINAVLLPILAELGVFKPKKGTQLMQVKLVPLPPEKKVAQKKPPQKKKVAKTKPRPHPMGRRQEHTAEARPSRPNPNQPHVVAQAGGNGNGPTIENNGTGSAGVVPVAPPAPTPKPVAPAQPPPPAPQPEQHPTPPPVTAPPTPAPPPPPVYAEATPIAQPQPEIPDDLAGDPIHTTFWGLFTIHADGSTDVKMVQSTGYQELDQAALDAARKWTFKPGTKNGQPIDSYRRLRIDIDVS